MEGFCVQRGYSGREVNAVLSSAASLGVEVCWSVEALAGWVPVGTVEWCGPVFGKHRVNFFPEFLEGLMGRKFMRTGWLSGAELCEDGFVKAVWMWKSEWESAVYPAGTVLPAGDWWVVEPVVFEQEWRYYVAGGRVVTTGWYLGEDEDEPAPVLDVAWPAGFSGAVDFGRLADGRMALVECHAPFACGWYGERHRDYAEWLLESWRHREWWLRTPKTDG